MLKFLLAYHVPRDYTPGRPETVAAWTGWFKSMGDSLVDQGQGVNESGELGNCQEGVRLGGYSLVTAADLEAALALTKGCPALGMGGGVEVGKFIEQAPAAT
jgi:hypothetical protein